MPEALCQCGCGAPVSIARQTMAAKGYVKGQPVRFRPFHATRIRPTLLDDPLASCVVMDCGYDTPCWVWQRSLAANGYARAGVDNRTVQVHRYLYERERGLLPPGHQCDHLCRTRACIRVDHLEAVPMHVNGLRGLKTKLSKQQVDAIASFAGTARAAAREFGISDGYAARIKRGAAVRVQRGY